MQTESCWNDLGFELEGVDHDFLRVLEKNTIYSADQEKLDKVIEKWIEGNQMMCAWATLITTCNDIGMDKVAQELDNGMILREIN